MQLIAADRPTHTGQATRYRQSAEGGLAQEVTTLDLNWPCLCVESHGIPCSYNSPEYRGFIPPIARPVASAGKHSQGRFQAFNCVQGKPGSFFFQRGMTSVLNGFECGVGPDLMEVESIGNRAIVVDLAMYDHARQAP